MKIFSYIFYFALLITLFKIGSFIIRRRYERPAFVGFSARRPVKALKTAKILAVVGFLGIILWGVGVFGATIFEEDFETYNVGSLLGQGGWVDIGNGSYFVITSTTTIEGDRTLQATSRDNGAWTGVKKPGDEISTGQMCFKFKTDAIDFAGQAQIEFMEDAGYRIIISMPPMIAGNNKFQYHDGASYIAFATSNYEIDTEYIICTQWDSATDLARYQIDCGDWSAWDTGMASFNYINVFRIQSAHSTGHNYFFDDIAEDLCLPPEEPDFRIWGSDPASSTEITATSTDFTFGYEGFATSTEGFAGWNGIIVNFCEEITGICTKEKKYPKSELGGTSGEKTLAFGDFDFDANGHWDLIGTAYYGSFNYNWVWVEGYLGNVVSPDYYVEINFEGLPDIFQVEVPATWYTEHTEYATSTAFFSSVSDILTPIFSKIGEFGNRVSGFFNQEEAYSRGQNIGAILPTFKLYIAQFSFLFGGFPIIETFILAMVVMVGFFLFKLVFRLIRG